MNGPAHYTPYHPRWYRRPVSVWWWLESWRYTRFVLRELTSLFVALFALVTLWQVGALAEGRDAYASFLAQMRTPLFLALHGVALLFVLFHALTWFHLAPTAMVIRLGGKRVPAAAIVVANYFAWLAASAAAAWFFLRG